MAYDLRTLELRKRFEFFKTTLPYELFATLSINLDNILRAREEGLTALAELLADKGDDKKGDAYNSKLSDLSKAQLEQFQNFLQGIRDVPPNLTAFRDIASAEESRFWDGLKAAKAGEARDAQMTACHDLEWFTAIMRSRWTTLSDTEKDLLQKERYYAAQLREVVKKAFEEVVPDSILFTRDGVKVLALPETAKKYINDKYKEVLRSLAEKVGGDPKKIDAFIKALEQRRSSIQEAAKEAGLDPEVVGKVMDALTKPGGLLATVVFEGISLVYNPLGSLMKTAAKVAKTLEPVAQAVVDQKVGEIRGMMGGRQTVLVTFSTTRREANEYVQKNGYEQAKGLYQESRRALETWQGQLKDAQNGDARTLALRADEATSYFLEQMRQVHSKFVDEFKGILIESVSDRTIDALADRPFYEEWANGIDSLDMDQKLNQLYAGFYELNGNIDRAFGLMTTFNDMPLESQAMIQEMVNRFENEAKQPFTKEMQSTLATLDAARGKQPASVTKAVKAAATSLAQQYARV